MLRFLALGAVVLAGLALGQLYALQLQARYRDLESLRAGLRGLMTEIEYAKKPLPEAWKELAGVYGGACSMVFDRASRLFGTDGHPTAGRAWRGALADCRGELHLSREDARIMDGLGAVLGKSGRADQVNHIRSMDERLAAQMEEARGQSARRGRLSRSLGLLGGMLMAVILA